MITKKLLLFLFLGIVSSYLTACGSTKNSSSPEQPIKQEEKPDIVEPDIAYEIPKDKPVKPGKDVLEIPEPSTFVFVSLGAIALIAKRRRYNVD